MPAAEPGAVERHAAIFAALGDPTRLDILGRLSSGAPQSIMRLTSGTGLSRQAVSKHLAVMEGVGLVRAERAGRERLYVFDAGTVDAARNHLARIAAQWDDALQRLKAFVETPD